MVLDADGLNAHAGRLRELAGRNRRDGPHAARGRARPAARARQRGDRARAPAPRSRGGRAGRSGRRAEGRRHARRRARRTRRGEPRRQPGAGDSRHRRRAHRRDRGAARPGTGRIHGRRARACGCTRRPGARPRAGREPSRASIATDVIAALPAARAEDVVSPPRAQASVNVAAIERNCARLRSELRAGAALCAVVKADGYGHGAAQSARAALAGGASWLAVATRAGGARAARGGHRARRRSW